MTIFWVIIITGLISGVQGIKELNEVCRKEVLEGTSTTIYECKQFHKG
jgi:hypothetical protein